MADPKVPARKDSLLPSLLTDVMSSEHLPAGNAWFGPQAGVVARKTKVVNNSIEYNLARGRQSDSLASAIDARIRLARKYAEVLDLPNLLAEDQREREHGRALAEHRRVLASVDAVHSLHVALAQHELELAKIREHGVRAQRNLEAAQRMKDVEVDRWYAEAEARKNNAYAERQDAADLLRGGSGAQSPQAAADAAAKQRDLDLATVEHAIELERERGNAAGVMVLTTLRARLRAA